MSQTDQVLAGARQFTYFRSRCIFSSQLTSLDLSNTGLKDFPIEISKMLSLDELNLKNNDLGPECPVGLGKLKNLHLLNLSGNNLFSPLSRDIGDLKRLVKLDVSKNKLNEFEEDVLCKLEHLHHLNASENFIETMPPNFGSLFELQVLILDNNRLTEFPNDRIDVMGSLQTLSMHGNYIECFPMDLPYTKIQKTFVRWGVFCRWSTLRTTRPVWPDFVCFLEVLRVSLRCFF